MFWDDTHNHTGNSLDVHLFGTPSATQDIAYRYAKGEPVINPATGCRWQIHTLLDFLVVANHAQMLGAMVQLYDESDKLITDTKSGKALLKLGGSNQITGGLTSCWR